MEIKDRLRHVPVGLTQGPLCAIILFSHETMFVHTRQIARRPLEHVWIALACLAALLLFAWALLAVRDRRRSSQHGAESFRMAPLTAPVRAMPDRFPSGTHRPDTPEGETSGSIDLATFSPGRDLMFIDDTRVWWESDNDTGDMEDDHTIHRSMEGPLRRLIELMALRGAVLKVQDTYRPTGIHNQRSLHKEGRAIDVTSDDISLEELAKLCWAAGFDWVYHEANGRYGTHVHCSVKR